MSEPLQPQEPLIDSGPSDLEKFASSVKDHPLRFALGIILILAVGLGLMAYSTTSETLKEEAATELVRATTVEEPAQRIPQLDAIVSSGSPLSAEALYLKAETAFDEGDYDTARAGFEQIVTDFPSFQFAPDALEGIGYVEEAKGNYEAAILQYLDVQVKYPDSYAARRQHYNLGRAYAAQGKVKEAIDSYRRQIGEFAESVVAAKAQHALQQYQVTHPELFKEFDQQLTTGADAPDEIELVTVPDATPPVTPETAEAPKAETGAAPEANQQ